MRQLLAALLFVFSGCAIAQGGIGTPARLYAVVFEVNVDRQGQIASLVVKKVTDPRISTDPVNVAIPQVYVEAATLYLRSLKPRKPPAPGSRYYTYTFYDPAQPERADIDPEAEPRASPAP